MSFKSQMSALFPGVHWDGASGIHVSIYEEIHIKEWTAISGEGSVEKKAQFLFNSLVPNTLYKFLQATFPALEFILTMDQFKTLMVADAIRHLRGEGDVQTPSKILNPSTGNVFSPIACGPEQVVAGIRFWEYGSYGLGWRFRITQANHIAAQSDAKAIILDRSKTVESMLGICEAPKAVEETSPLIEKE